MTLKYNSFSYLIGEGFGNVFKNKKSTMASLVIMCATMLIFGTFFAIGENIDHVMTQIESSQGFQVFATKEATEEQVKTLGEQIRAINGVSTAEYVSKQEGMNTMKERFKDKAGVLAGWEDPENNPLTDSYIVKLTDLSLNEEVQSQVSNLENVKTITSSNKTITTLMSLTNGIRIATFVLLVILIVISIFIISNTIKLTMHARRKEISIMKYVGATNNFIRGPFIVEGIIIGILSGALSIVIVGGLYKIITDKLMMTEFMLNMNVSLLTFSDMFNLIVIVYTLLGIGIGVIGSTISMRKYLKV